MVQDAWCSVQGQYVWCLNLNLRLRSAKTSSQISDLWTYLLRCPRMYSFSVILLADFASTMHFLSIEIWCKHSVQFHLNVNFIQFLSYPACWFCYHNAFFVSARTRSLSTAMLPKVVIISLFQLLAVGSVVWLNQFGVSSALTAWCACQWKWYAILWQGGPKDMALLSSLRTAKQPQRWRRWVPTAEVDKMCFVHLLVQHNKPSSHRIIGCLV